MRVGLWDTRRHVSPGNSQPRPGPGTAAPILDEALRVQPVQYGVCIRGQLTGVDHELIVLRCRGAGGAVQG